MKTASTKTAWVDLRRVPDGQRAALAEVAVHARLDAVVDDDLERLRALPPTVTKVLMPRSPADALADGAGADIIVSPVHGAGDLAVLAGMARAGDGRVAAYVEVSNSGTLGLACEAAVALPHTVVRFTDPTKIPLEIVIAAADRSSGRLITMVEDLEEAGIVLGVLEKGSDGVLMMPKAPDDVLGLAQRLRAATPRLDLVPLTVTAVAHTGMGERVCVDTCSHFAQDEGILVGSFSAGFVLCCSETHPLPYMPTRPFRVNAGALHSYVLGLDNRTNYLSELRSGAQILGVGADGRTRVLTVGRVKIETRPLLTISATAPDGTAVSLTVQDDWHVRVLGPGAAVLNVTELASGHQVLGYLATDQRHVGIPVHEFCLEA